MFTKRWQITAGLSSVLWTCTAVQTVQAVPPVQRAESAGHARFPVLLHSKGGLVTVYQGGRARGTGELLPFLARPGIGEFRGKVPKGAFRLGPLRDFPKKEKVLLPYSWSVSMDERKTQLLGISIDSITVKVRLCEGRRVPRYRIAVDFAGGRAEGDAFFWPGAALELRLWIQAHQDWKQLEGCRVRLPAALGNASLVYGPGLRIAPVENGSGQQLILPVGHLRPGDGCLSVLVFGDMQSTDPTLRVLPVKRLLKPLGYGLRPGGRAAHARLVRNIEQSLRSLFREAPTGVLDRGDFLRRQGRTGQKAVWTHLEFDLALGLLLRAVDCGDPESLSRGLAACLHILGRDRSRIWDRQSSGNRLPVIHGPKHGRGAVDQGHVFLEGCLLASVLTVDRLLLARSIDCLNELHAHVQSRLLVVERLRELAWPLLNLEAGLRLLDRKSWAKTSDMLVKKLAASWDRGIACFSLPESLHKGGRRSLDVWLVCGLVIPALRRARTGGSSAAGKLLNTLKSALARLPLSRGLLATHYSKLPGKGWFASGSGGDPCCLAWVLEGLARDSRFRRAQRTLRARLVRDLPGPGWDPATRLALLLRLDWVREANRAHGVRLR